MRKIQRDKKNSENLINELIYNEIKIIKEYFSLLFTWIFKETTYTIDVQ